MHTTTRRWFLKSSAAIGAAMFTVPAVMAETTASQQAGRDGAPDRTTFAIETYVARTYNYLDNMVDQTHCRTSTSSGSSRRRPRTTGPISATS